MLPRRQRLCGCDGTPALDNLEEEHGDQLALGVHQNQVLAVNFSTGRQNRLGLYGCRYEADDEQLFLFKGFNHPPR
jgi:hypothetical protein